MWIEAILTKDDLAQALTSLLPATIRLGNDREARFYECRDVALVANEGLRATCKADLWWSVLGINIPVHIKSLSVMLSPSVSASNGSESLAFKLRISEIDLSLVPRVIDDGLAVMLNTELANRELDLAWRFTQTLKTALRFPPPMIEPRGISTRVRWGKVRVTEESVVFAISFGLDFTRSAGSGAEVPSPVSVVAY